MIRTAASGDAADMARIEVAAFATDAWSPAQVAAELAAPTRDVVVADEGGTIVGYASMAVAGDTADLIRIAVTDAVRRTGVGSMLLAAIHERAALAGAERILLEVAAVNDVARAFYAARGYVEIARRPRYYADGDDAVVLSAPLR